MKSFFSYKVFHFLVIKTPGSGLEPDPDQYSAYNDWSSAVFWIRIRIDAILILVGLAVCGSGSAREMRRNAGSRWAKKTHCKRIKERNVLFE
jgi:hypothetical protein